MGRAGRPLVEAADVSLLHVLFCAASAGGWQAGRRAARETAAAEGAQGPAAPVNTVPATGA